MINFIHFQVDLSFVCILGSRFSLIALFLFLCFVFNLLWEYPELETWAARVKWHDGQGFASLVCLFILF